jgi:hypothetical protein
MDPITTAIVAALPALGAELFKSSIKDAYEGLKAVIRQRWGNESRLAKSIEALEERPKSKGEALTLSENIAEVKATADPQVMHALSKLADALKKERLIGNGPLITTNVIDSTVQGIVGAANVSIGSMNVGAPPQRKR